MTQITTVGYNSDTLTASSMARQAIINGNFDVWQRGTTVTDPSSNTFLADRWRIQKSADGGTPPTIIHSRQETTPGDIDGAFYFYRINVDGAGSSLGNGAYNILNQWIEHGVRYLCGDGKKVTLSFKARSSIANKNIGATIIQVYGSGGSPSSSETITGEKFSLTSSWQDFELTVDTNTLSGKTFGTNNDDYLVARFFTMWGTTFAPSIGETTAESFVGAGNIDIAQVQLCAGDIALPFEPKSFCEELELCQRYYQKSYEYGTVPSTNTAVGIVTLAVRAVSTTATQGVCGTFAGRMRTTPTITGYRRDGAAAGEWRVNAASYYDVLFVPADSGFYVYISDAAAPFTTGVFYMIDGHWVAEAEL